MIDSKKILIFGGAFNPPHIGHLHILLKAIDYIKPHETIICVDKVSPWKQGGELIPYTYRVNMFNNLAGSQVKYHIYENKNNLVYTSDIIKELHEAYANDELFFLVGQDQYELIQKWNNYDVINNLSTIVCYKRGKNPIKRLNDKHIILADSAIDCASSDIRKNINPESVGQKNFDYIRQRGLYTQSQIQKYMSERRYQHTLRVLDTITKIATKNKWNDDDVLKCQSAALLHDIAKQLNDQELRAIISNDELSQFPTYHCAHGLAGARLAQKDFGVTDHDILDAIENHVIFKDIHSPNKIAKALFLADKLEPARTEADIPNRARLFNYACEDYEKAFQLVYKLNKEKY